MKKIKSNSVFLLIVSILTLLYISCGSDNQIMTPPDTEYRFDSARYDWTIYSFNSSSITFDSFNDSNIFILSINNLREFDGINFIDHYFGYDGFSALSMDGMNNNNIYIGGYDNSVSNYLKPRLKKWTGSSFIEIPILDTTKRLYQILSVFSIDINEIFIGTTKGDIICYKNGEFEFYRIDSSFYVTEFASDQSGNFYFVAQKVVFDSSTIRYLDIYIKNNNRGWNKIFSEIYTHLDPNEITPSMMNNNIIGFQHNVIKKFNGASFVKIFEVEPFDIYQISQFSDTTTDFFLIPGVERESSDIPKLFQWNGSSWSKELNLPDEKIYGSFFHRLKNVKGKYYFLVEDDILDISFLGKGIVKQIKKF